ncbi:hypothetical protein PG990_012246 [Apiospora arundinis]
MYEPRYVHPYSHVPYEQRVYWQQTNMLQAPYRWDGSMGRDFYLHYPRGNPQDGWPRQHLRGYGDPTIIHNPQTYDRSLEARGVPMYPMVNRGIW